MNNWWKDTVDSEKHRKLHEEHEELKKLVRDFLWSTVHHREKVPHQVWSMLETVCSYMPEDVRWDIRGKVLQKILYGRE